MLGVYSSKYSGLLSKRFKPSPSHKISETCTSSEKLRLGRGILKALPPSH